MSDAPLINGWTKANRLPQGLEDAIAIILRDKGFGIRISPNKYIISYHGNRKSSHVVGRFRPENLVRGLCDPQMIRGPMGSSQTCGWSLDFPPGEPENKLDNARGPIPQITKEDRELLMIARLSS